VPRLAVAMWVGGLAGVIALAVLGGQPPGDQADQADIARMVPSARPSGDPGLVAASTATPTVAATRVPPPPADARATLRRLVVRGRVARGAADVWLMLATERGTPVSTARLDPTGHGHGSWIPFESRLLVMRSAANVGDPLYVVTVDPNGAPFDGMRHRYSAGIFLVVGSDGQATSAQSGPAATATRGFPSSSTVSVFGHARPAISLDRPQGAGARLVTADVVVSGALGRRVARVDVALVADDGSTLATTSSAPVLAPRTGWHDAPDTFSVRLLLPDPRPTGPASIRVVTRDEDDQPVDTLTTAVRIEPLARPSVGADGLVGGIVFGVPFDERARP
jgi:hypothetical protein